MLLQEALIAEHERSAKESTEAIQGSLTMQKAQFEAEIEIMKNRLEHEKVSGHCPWSHSFLNTLTLAFSIQCPEESNHQPEIALPNLMLSDYQHSARRPCSQS